MNVTPAPTTLIETLSGESSTSPALERVRAGLAPWLVASATKFTHPDKQVRAELSLPERTLEVMLSGPEAEAAIRQLMQAYADSIGKSLTFCVYPKGQSEPPCFAEKNDGVFYQCACSKCRAANG